MLPLHDKREKETKETCETESQKEREIGKLAEARESERCAEKERATD